MQITYTKQGDYYLPDLVLPETQNKANLGKYAILRLNYLKQNKKALYQAFLMKNELTKHLEEVDNIAKAKVKRIVNQMARENNVAILFEEDNINTMDTRTSEMLLTTLSAVAKQESENISEHVKLGLRMKMNRGELIGFTKCYGYEYDVASENFKIIEEEAEVVKFIFDQYCAGHGANGIAKMLTQQGIRTPKGRKTWSDSTVRGILRNEKYKGDVLQGKTYTSDPISHKRYKNMGEADKYYIANHHEPIIGEKQFEFVQEILKENCGARVNGRRVGNVGRKFAFSSRIRCGFCGNCYVRRTVVGKDREKIPSWSCMSFAKNGKTACTESKTIREEMIKEAFVDSYKLLCANKEFATDEFLKVMKQTMGKNDRSEELEKLNKEYRDVKAKKNKLLDLLLEDRIAQEDYEEKVDKCNTRLETLENKIEQLKLLSEDRESIEDGLKKIKGILSTNDIMEEFDQEVFNALIDYVIVGGYDENGVKDQYLIRFILKREFDYRVPKDIPEELIVQNNKIDLEDKNVFVDFVNCRKYFSYEKDELGKLCKVLRNGLRIRVECDIN